MSKKRDFSAALLGMHVALILWITILGRETQISGKLFYPPFHSITDIWREIQRTGFRSNLLGNIILFVPLGIILPIVTNWKYKTVIVGSFFSIFIEIFQLITLRGCFDFDDVILNSIGCVIGYGIYKTAQRLFAKNTMNESGV